MCMGREGLGKSRDGEPALVIVGEVNILDAVRTCFETGRFITWDLEGGRIVIEDWNPKDDESDGRRIDE